MATCSVSGTIVDSSSTAVSGAVVRFHVTKPVLDGSNNLVVPTEVSTTTAASGAWTLVITQGISGLLTIDFPASSSTSQQRANYTISVPATTTAAFASLFPSEV